ncbi:predicted protein [Sclerotinia sclerotiorum 1980 UF-70]|uniref:Uncharacterized protein n=1 Tax=Sclerotinia sclerotiorum (strain ATCC 18683 / 1980 / Ss-1) TaxID=665079 RepID=A7EW63_SCLS1|nr:predicted protein [Sclerotinia sclerotiorum 1980 UF-70]EDN93705.1 predicted protein [Sclerotinia sclerotiorum 1980 UF-70]
MPLSNAFSNGKRGRLLIYYHGNVEQNKLGTNKPM